MPLELIWTICLQYPVIKSHQNQLYNVQDWYFSYNSSRTQEKHLCSTRCRWSSKNILEVLSVWHEIASRWLEWERESHHFAKISPSEMVWKLDCVVFGKWVGDIPPSNLTSPPFYLLFSYYFGLFFRCSWWIGQDVRTKAIHSFLQLWNWTFIAVGASTVAAQLFREGWTAHWTFEILILWSDF